MRGFAVCLLSLVGLAAGCGEAEAPEAVDGRTLENRDEARREVLELPSEAPSKD